MRERAPSGEPDDLASARPDAPVELAPDPPISFVDLYRSAYADMVRLAYLLTGSQETAEDVVQDAFARMHRTYSRIDEPRAYLRRSVVNACTSHHRTRLRRQRISARLHDAQVEELGADELFDVLAQLN